MRGASLWRWPQRSTLRTWARASTASGTRRRPSSRASPTSPGATWRRPCSCPWRYSSPGRTAGRTRSAPPIPRSRVSETGIAASFLVGAGMNGILPARGGDALKIVLAKRSVERSSYPTIISSFAVLSPFDIAIGLLVLLYAITQGLLPRAPRLPHLPAFEITFWAAHPEVLMLTLTVIGIGLVDAGRGPLPGASSPSGSGSSRDWRSSASRPDTCARSRPGRGSAGCAGSPRSGSSSRPSTSAARSRTCSW